MRCFESLHKPGFDSNNRRLKAGLKTLDLFLRELPVNFVFINLVFCLFNPVLKLEREITAVFNSLKFARKIQSATLKLRRSPRPKPRLRH